MILNNVLVMPIGKCSIEIDKFNTKMFPRNYGEVICFVSKSWLKLLIGSQ